MIYLHNIELEGEDDFTYQFNLCSYYYQKSVDETLSESERELNWELFQEQRYKLETGHY